MPTIFERIVAGEIPSHKVWEDAHHYAFLDINPRCAGHTLVVPKRATDYIFDMTPEAHAALWNAAREVATKLKRVLACKRVVVGVWGYEVPHTHIHLFPTNALNDLPMPPMDEVAKAGLAEVAKRLKP